ncbi:MAG: hypothetical protein R3E01_15210 [Pirellulaceae bacterium]|nr:hypothetical protein [Planctomycetales bacterium]
MVRQTRKIGNAPQHDDSGDTYDDGNPESEGPIEIAVVGDLTDNESELTDRLISVPPGGSCTMFFDSPGGSPYAAISLMTIIKLRGIVATGIVSGECSSAALWPFAACRRRIVTPYSVLLFHPMKWQSEEHVGLHEAAEWARHFAHLEIEMDQLLADLFGVPAASLADWINPGKYVTGREFASAGLGELMELTDLSRMSASANGAKMSSGNIRRGGTAEAGKKQRRPA